MKNNLFLIGVLAFLLFGCGFKAIYSENANVNFKITSIEFSGDREVNNIIRSNLTRYTYAEREIEQTLKIETEFEKKVLAKDGSGSPTDFQLTVNTFLVADVLFPDGKIKNYKFSYSEKNNIKNNDDNFEQKNYEDNIKSNLSTSISYQIIFDLIN